MLLPLIFELDIYLRHMKFFRIFNLMAAIFAYAGGLVATLVIMVFLLLDAVHLFDAASGVAVGVLSFALLVPSCLFLYLLLTWPLNLAIILKEFTLEYF